MVDVAIITVYALEVPSLTESNGQGAHHGGYSGVSRQAFLRPSFTAGMGRQGTVGQSGWLDVYQCRNLTCLKENQTMSGILDAIIKSLSPEATAKVLPLGQSNAPDPSAAAGAVLSAIVRGMAQKSQTQEGASSLWDMITKHAGQGAQPTDSPASGKGIEVRDMDPKVTDEILGQIFGENAGQVQGRVGKVITLDAETTKKLMGAILPSILGGLLGHAKESSGSSPQSLPDILGKARDELNQRQSKSGGAFDDILDRDHDGNVDLSDLISILKGGGSGAAAPKAPSSAGPTDF